MLFSKRFLALLASGIVPVIVASFIGLELYAFLIYNIIIFSLFIVDFRITPDTNFLCVERVCQEKLSMGTENEIGINIRNNSGYALDIEAVDEVPEYMKTRNSIVKIRVAPHYEAVGNYYVVPEKRGEFKFGKIHIRYKGVMGLCMKKGIFDLENTYKVYPNLKDLSKYGLAAIKKSQLIQGIKKNKSFGIGTEFESLREYTEGDDYRKINWMATARANKFIVNTYQHERNQQVMIMLDSSRVMNSEINRIKKLDYSINAAFLLADVALKKGDNAGVMVFDNTVKRFIKPGKGMGQFQLIAENLYNVQENFVTADYVAALTYLNRNQKRRSLLCIFTELFNADEAFQLASALKNLARQHIPLIITIKDMRLYDYAEGNIEDTKGIFTQVAAMKLISEREKIKKIFNDSSIAVVDVPPYKLSIEVVNKYLSMKSMMQI